MGFVRRMATTGKVPISEEVRKEVEMTYFHSTVTTIENKKIPKSLAINLDQTPSKYVLGCNKTLAPKGVKNVSIAGLTDKRTITATYLAMLLMDVFKGQMTGPAKEILKRNNIILQKVPANLTYLFQVLDVQGGRPNGYAKRLMKKKFTFWYADQVQCTMDGNPFKSIEENDIDLKLGAFQNCVSS